jgi:DNA adenine methylase
MIPDNHNEKNGIKPPLKWAGGKRWLVPYLLTYWKGNEHKRLVEPLCGGLAISLSLLPKSALLNDINPHLMNFYYHLKQGLNISIRMENDSQLFYDHRKRFNELIKQNTYNSSESAELFYFLNRTCYNGLCRFNSKGYFNTPFGKYKKINYQRDFLKYKEIFDNWEFMQGDYSELEIFEDDFIYADPPYDVEFTKYSKEDFTWENQIELAEWLSRHKGIVILSNQATERVLDLYTKLGFKMQILDAPRRINCTGDRTPAKEVLALKGV